MDGIGPIDEIKDELYMFRIEIPILAHDDPAARGQVYKVLTKLGITYKEFHEAFPKSRYELRRLYKDKPPRGVAL